MSVAMSWIVTPNLEVSNCFGYLDTAREGTRVLDSSRLGSRDRNMRCSARLKKVKLRKWSSSSFNAEFSYSCLGASELENGSIFPVHSSMVVSADGDMAVSSEQKVYDVVLKQAALVKRQLRSDDESEVKPEMILPGTLSLLSEAYDRCGEVCAEYAKTFYLGTLLMTPGRRRAIWAIYAKHDLLIKIWKIDIHTHQGMSHVLPSDLITSSLGVLISPIPRFNAILSLVWCRRTDELVDGPNASHITPSALDRWESRLEDLFKEHPFDMLDAALSDTVIKYPVDIQPFKDMIEGMRMDLKKSRYQNFDELYLYCYYVAGTVGLMSVPIMGIAPDSQATTESVYNAALALGLANQLTNILRDVGEDARRGRVYLPQDELAQAGLSDEDIFAGKVTDKWRNFMKKQIKRARMFFDEAELGVRELSPASRWPVWASLLLYRQILDEIEANDYNNFTKRAYVSKPKKILALPVAYAKALAPTARTGSTLLKT